MLLLKALIWHFASHYLMSLLIQAAKKKFNFSKSYMHFRSRFEVTTTSQQQQTEATKEFGELLFGTHQQVGTHKCCSNAWS